MLTVMLPQEEPPLANHQRGVTLRQQRITWVRELAAHAPDEGLLVDLNRLSRAAVGPHLGYLRLEARNDEADKSHRAARRLIIRDPLRWADFECRGARPRRRNGCPCVAGALGRGRRGPGW